MSDPAASYSAASVNPLDWRMKNRRPGVDVAGEVVATGKRVRSRIFVTSLAVLTGPVWGASRAGKGNSSLPVRL
jgi:hypothetical protein